LALIFAVSSGWLYPVSLAEVENEHPATQHIHKHLITVFLFFSII